MFEEMKKKLNDKPNILRGKDLVEIGLFGSEANVSYCKGQGNIPKYFMQHRFRYFKKEDVIKYIDKLPKNWIMPGKAGYPRRSNKVLEERQQQKQEAPRALQDKWSSLSLGQQFDNKFTLLDERITSLENRLNVQDDSFMAKVRRKLMGVDND